MNTDNASLYVKWLKQEVAPALGCTEPVAISFAAAYAAQYLDQPCTKISGFISANLYKNAMGVTIPGTTVCGVPLAAAIGAFGGDPQKGLKTLEDITPRHVEMAQKLIANNAVDIAVEETPDFIHLDLTLSAGENYCRVVVKGTHTNVVELYINGQPQPLSEKQNTRTQRETLPTFSLQQAYEFINRVDFNDIRFILDAARLNSALAAEGKTKKYGLNINGTFSDAVKNGLMSNDLLSSHRPQRVIEAVAVKDIGKARGDNDLKAVIGQRPRRVLARGAAAEVFPRQQYRCPLVLRKIQHELRVRLLTFIVEKAPVVKQVRAKAGAGDLLQKLLRDDRVGIDVCSIQRNHQAGMLGKFLCHDGLLTSDYGYRRNGR